MERKLDSLATDLGALNDLKEQMAVVADATAALPAMDGRMATIEGAMPALLEVQQHLARRPETLEGMRTGLDRLSELMERLLTSMDRLDGDVDQLQQSIQPLGRRTRTSTLLRGSRGSTSSGCDRNRLLRPAR